MSRVWWLCSQLLSTNLRGNFVSPYFQTVTDVQGAFSSCFLAGPVFLSGLPPNRICSTPDSHLTLQLQELSASPLTALKTDNWKNITRSSPDGMATLSATGKTTEVLPTGPMHTRVPSIPNRGAGYQDQKRCDHRVISFSILGGGGVLFLVLFCSFA